MIVAFINPPAAEKPKELRTERTWREWQLGLANLSMNCGRELLIMLERQSENLGYIKRFASKVLLLEYAYRYIYRYT